MMMKRKRFHQYVFVTAGIYNVSWGIWTAVRPQDFFRFSGLEPINHPAIFACLGMVVGLYGLLYLDVAWKPEKGWHIALIGLLGKVLGPLGMMKMVFMEGWPISAFYLCLTNDFIWWIPFIIYLYDSYSPWLADRNILKNTPKKLQ